MIPGRPHRLPKRAPLIVGMELTPDEPRSFRRATRRPTVISRRVFVVGDTAAERVPEGASFVKITMPNGTELVVPLTTDMMTVELPLAGAWRYEWPDGSGGTWEVVPGPEQKESIVEELVTRVPSHPLSTGPA